MKTALHPEGRSEAVIEAANAESGAGTEEASEAMAAGGLRENLGVNLANPAANGTRDSTCQAPLEIQPAAGVAGWSSKQVSHGK